MSKPTKQDPPPQAEAKTHANATKPREISLIHHRNRQLGTMVIQLGFGLAGIVFLGFIGKLLSCIFLLFAAGNGIRVYRTFGNPPGTFHLSPNEIIVPSRRFGNRITLTPEQVQDVFFLRRATPWFSASPTLVVEANGHSYAYPRNWFASDEDQEQVFSTLRERSNAGR